MDDAQKQLVGDGAGAGLMAFLFGVALTGALVFLIAVWMPA